VSVVLLAAAAYWAAMAITPGPNNILLTNSGLKFGVRRTLPLIAGVQTGVFAQNLGVAGGLGALFLSQPWLQIALKVIGSGYILWLAWHSLRSTAPTDGTEAIPIGFLTATLFQFANPKSWLSAITSATAFLGAGNIDLLRILAIAVVAAIVGTPSNFVWTLFGVGLKRILARPRALLIVNRVFATVLASTIILFWLPH
jgi:threonine/homoserine/homoserine lactone efflux protein